MPLANHFTIDEKTNRIINEFLMQDNKNNNNNNVKNGISHEETSKRRQQRIRQKTFDETMVINNSNIEKQTQQQPRTAFIKQRQHSFVQTNIRQQPASPYPSLHFGDSRKQNEDKSNSQSASSTLSQQSKAVVRMDNNIAVGSPSIIVTGYQSGS